MTSHLGTVDGGLTSPALRKHKAEALRLFRGDALKQQKLSFGKATGEGTGAARSAGPGSGSDVFHRLCHGYRFPSHTYTQRDGYSVAFTANPMDVVEDRHTSPTYECRPIGTDRCPEQHYRHVDCKKWYVADAEYDASVQWTCSACLSIPTMPSMCMKLYRISMLHGGKRPEMRTLQQTGGHPSAREAERLVHEQSAVIAALKRRLKRCDEDKRRSVTDIVASESRFCSPKAQAKKACLFGACG